TYNRSLNNIAYQVLVLLKPLNPPYSQSDLDAISAELRRPLNNSRTPGADTCQPIGAVPPQYGQTELTDYPDRLSDGLKLLPDLKSPARE
ncbi:MAG: hypothetical protein JO256_02760, partial [Alphaproteobacteria bacterium]|nr:hypothetical protein [Alphaproteobacteria bacterium]